jgi:hypothetical protein
MRDVTLPKRRDRRRVRATRSNCPERIGALGKQDDVVATPRGAEDVPLASSGRVRTDDW